MENTVDAVLAHGDSDPEDLLDRLQASKTGASLADMDEELARRLASQDEQRQQQMRANRRSQAPTNTGPDPSHVSPARAPAPAAAQVPKWKKGRGAATQLPPDFLRIPGNSSNMNSDEALARMLQDKLFAEEIANNPEFAHLARGNGRPGSRGTVGGFPGQMMQRRNPNDPPRNPGDPPEVLKALAGE